MNVAVVAAAILMISVIGALLGARRSASDKPRQMQILVFALYFWILVFLQLMLAALGYWLLAD